MSNINFMVLLIAVKAFNIIAKLLNAFVTIEVIKTICRESIGDPL
jgi:hypothetical protein